MTKTKFLTNVAICALSFAVAQPTSATEFFKNLCCCGGSDDDKRVDPQKRSHRSTTSLPRNIENGDGQTSPTTPLLSQASQGDNKSMGSLDSTSQNPLQTSLDPHGDGGIPTPLSLTLTPTGQLGDGGLSTPVKRTLTSPVPKASPKKAIVPSKTLTASDRLSATSAQQQLIALEDRVKFSEDVWQLLGKDDQCAQAILSALTTISGDFCVHAVVSNYSTGKCRLDITESSSQRQYSRTVSYSQ